MEWVVRDDSNCYSENLIITAQTLTTPSCGSPCSKRTTVVNLLQWYNYKLGLKKNSSFSSKVYKKTSQKRIKLQRTIPNSIYHKIQSINDQNESILSRIRKQKGKTQGANEGCQKITRDILKERRKKHATHDIKMITKIRV